MGTFPATYLANKYRLRLLSITSGHSGDWLTFHSPAARHVKETAISKGHTEQEFSQTLAPYNPIANVKALDNNSLFISGKNDLIIPAQSRNQLALKLSADRPEIEQRIVPYGHVCTLLFWQRYCDANW
jgi:formylmethanofuran dehydrogenase subunit E-like metal-binding protein